MSGKIKNLAGANLAGANLRDTDLTGANLAGANLAGANLVRANLTEADLREATLRGAQLSGTLFARADLRKADLQFAGGDSVDFTAAQLDAANLEGAYLNKAILPTANLRGAKLHNAFFDKADFRNADLSGCNMFAIRLHNADLRRANLYCANLEHADLAGADLRGANLHGANLTEADWRFALFVGASTDLDPTTLVPSRRLLLSVLNYDWHLHTSAALRAAIVYRLRDVLDEIYVKHQWHILSILAEEPSRELASYAQSALCSDAKYTRTFAITALAACLEQDALPYLAKMLDDNSPVVIETTLQQLAKMDITDDVADRITQFLTCDNTYIAQLAYDCLIATGHHDKANLYRMFGQINSGVKYDRGD